jgi:hypothetical protein
MKKTNEHKTILADLLYPSEEKKAEAAQRIKDLRDYPADRLSDLECERLAMMICPDSPSYALNIMKEMCIDTEVIRYRQEVLEDFINVPQLSASFEKSLKKLYTNDRTNGGKLDEPESFMGLHYRTDALVTYVECITEFHEFSQQYGDKVRSYAVKNILAYFDEVYTSESFCDLVKNLDKLSEALAERIRSVTVGINFDENMLPVSAGIISFSKETVDEKPSFIDRLLYSGSRQPADYFSGNMYTKFDPKTHHPNELDAALFKELTAVTNEYISNFNKALSSYYQSGTNEIYALETQFAFYSGAVRLIELVRQRGLDMCRPEILHVEKHRLDIKNTFDMILFRSMCAKITDDSLGNELITNDCTLDDETGFHILTGANNGGKTTYLRAVGIAQIMFQMGLYVPGTSAEISPVNMIYTHFPHEEDIGINASRFTTEIKLFKVICDKIDSDSLLLMNESLQSTTPGECVEIAEYLLRAFSIIGVRGIFATHLLDLAYKTDELNSEKDGRIKFDSIVAGVDAESGKRSYIITKSPPLKNSYARSVFKEFGIDIEEIKHRNT